jgi:hypothetical protein
MKILPALPMHPDPCFEITEINQDSSIFSWAWKSAIKNEIENGEKDRYK